MDTHSRPLSRGETELKQLCSLDCQSRFANAARTGQGEQAASRVKEKRGKLGEFVYPADEGNGMSWKIVCGHGSRVFSTRSGKALMRL